jgi:hypothetical protein
MKLPSSYARIVMPLILSVVMTCVVSATATLRVAGWVPGFTALWLSAWAWSWLIAFPTLLVALPVARRLSSLVVAMPAVSEPTSS